MKLKVQHYNTQAVLTRNIHIIYYTLLTLAVFFPLFEPGYILTLDTIWASNRNYIADHILNNGIGGQLPFLIILQFFEIFLPAWLTQKILLFSIFLISGITAHITAPSKSIYGKYFSGTLYAINPFIYTRFLAGHLYLLLAYAFVPLAIKSFHDFLLDNSNWKKALLWLSVIAIFDMHVLFTVLLIQFCVFIFFFAGQIEKRTILIINTLKLGLFFIIVNMFWILPVFLSVLAGSSILSNISDSDLTVFTGQGTISGNILISLAMMYGFWRGGYIYPFHFAPKWIFILLFSIILLFSVYGFISDRKKPMFKGLVLAAFISLVLASGISFPNFAPMFNYLFDHLFIFKGMRDSQKFIGILVLVYVWLGGSGVDKLITGLEIDKKKLYSIALIAIVVTIPIFYSFTIFNGFYGQIKTKDYPPGWYEINDVLISDPEDVDVLFFPWHMYMTFNWSDRRIANPAVIFFNKPVLSGQNAEVGNIQIQSSNPIQYYVEFLLDHRNEIDNFGELVTPLNVKYILLAKEVDYYKYNFLYNQSDLEIVQENEELVLFKNQHNTTRIRKVTSLIEIEGWDELLEYSKTKDINNYGFVFSDIDQNKIKPNGQEKLNYTQKSPFRFDLHESGQYVIFSSPTHDQSGWMYNYGNLEGIGIYSIYKSTENIKDDGKIYYKPFIVHVIGSIFSIIGVLFLLYPNFKLKLN